MIKSVAFLVSILTSAVRVESGVVYSNSFVGVAGTAGDATYPVTVISGFTDYSYATELDGNGHLQSVNNDSLTPNYRFSSLSSVANNPLVSAIKCTMVLRAPTTNWVGVGFEDFNSSGILYADAGPWVKIEPTSVTVYGGYAENNSAGIFSNTHASGSLITVEMIYHTTTGKVDLYVDNNLVDQYMEIMHWEQNTTTESDPAIDWLQFNFYKQDSAENGGAYLDSLVVESQLGGLQEPDDNASCVNPHPQFKWSVLNFEQGDNPIDHYEIQISTNRDFNTVLVDDTIQINRYVPLNPLVSDEYWWRVRSVQGETNSSWSIDRKFTVMAPVNTYVVSNNASASEIAEVLAVAQSHSPAEVSFQSGTYHVSPAADSWLLSLEGASDLIIDGNGASIIIETPDAGFSRFKSCTNITVRCFRIDYDPLPHTVGTITAVNTVSNTFDLELWDGYPRLDDPHMVASDLQGNWGSLMHKTYPGRLKSNVGDVFYTANSFPQVGTDTYRLTLTSPGIGNFEVDDVFVKVARVRPLNSAVFSAGLVYYDVINYAAPGGYFVGAYCDNVDLLKGGSQIKPNSGRWSSACADGVHCQGFRTGPWVEDCLFQGILDDCANIYSAPMFIYQKLSDTEIRFYITSTLDLCVNDGLRFFDAPSGTTVDYGRIVSVSTTNINGVGYRDITFDRSVGDVNPGPGMTNTTVYDMARTGQYFVFRHNTFADSRRYGLFIKSVSGLIVDNGFNCLSGPAITLHNNPNCPEGLNSTGISIISNLMTGCMFSSYHLTQERGCIEMYTEGYDGSSVFESSWRGHNGIHIQGNTIENWQRRAIKAHCVTDLLVEGNIITNTATGFISGQSNYGIFLNNTGNAMVLNNQVVDIRPMDGAIEVQNSDSVIVDGNTIP